MRLGSLRTIDDIKAALTMRDNLDADDMWRIISALCDVVAQYGAAILDGVVTGRSGPVEIAVPWVEPPPTPRRIAPVQPVQQPAEAPVPVAFDPVPPVPVLPRLEWGEEIPPQFHQAVRTLAAQGWSHARLATTIWGKRTPRALELLSSVLAVEGATLAEIAARLNISRERARQLRAQGLRRLRAIAT